MIQTGFFTHEIQLRRLDQLGDSLKEVGEAIDFEMFRPSLASLLGVHTGVVGRKPLDQVFMFKILVLQVIRGLSDEALEFHLNDSASAQRFIGRSPHDTMPDSTSIWLFRDKLAAARVTRSDDGTDSPGEEIDGVRALFDVFHQQLADKGLLCREGKTVDAMIVEVPRQRNSRKENESIKNGEVPDAWKGQPRKLAQKDTDARWTKKRNVTYFGYKDSVVGESPTASCTTTWCPRRSITTRKSYRKPTTRQPGRIPLPSVTAPTGARTSPSACAGTASPR
jgi:hypothetical protein